MISRITGFTRYNDLRDMRNKLIDADLNVKDIFEDDTAPKEIKMLAISVSEDIGKLKEYYNNLTRECKNEIKEGLKNGDLIV